MENPKKQLLERLKSANNVLVTVSANPSVDQLSAAIGFTLLLNKMGKHATAVFSGEIPSTIEFLQPEKTLEKNTDSLRDFIIALDKSKADKLRYKVEDSHVKIFITPYRTSITKEDLDFSQGDFNVEVVVALGVNDQKDLDQAITAHGRILHDATTISITNGPASSLGSINWSSSDTSSLCEMTASLADTLQQGVLDGQMATAFMTGIVAETARFSNDKTTPQTMSISAALMAAGANQQLVASKLQEGEASQETPQVDGSTDVAPVAEVPKDGSLQIEHQLFETEELPDPEPTLPIGQVTIDTDGNVVSQSPEKSTSSMTVEPSVVQGGSSMILEPPTLGGKLTANTEPEQLDPATDPLGAKTYERTLLNHQEAGPAEEQQSDTENLGAFVADEQANTDEVQLEQHTEALSDVPTAHSESQGDIQADQLSQTVDMELPEPVPASENAPDTPSEPESQPLGDNDHARPADEGTTNTEPEPEEFHERTLTELEEAVRGAYSSVPEQNHPLEGVEGIQLPAEQVQPEPFVPTPTENIGGARDAVSAALADSNEPLPPIAALNAQPLDLDIQQTGETGIITPPSGESPMFTMPENLLPSADMPVDMSAAPVQDPTAPPTVPPPLPPDMYGTFTPQAQVDRTSSPQGPSQGAPEQSVSSQNPFNLPPA